MLTYPKHAIQIVTGLLLISGVIGCGQSGFRPLSQVTIHSNSPLNVSPAPQPSLQTEAQPEPEPQLQPDPDTQPEVDPEPQPGPSHTPEPPGNPDSLTLSRENPNYFSLNGSPIIVIGSGEHYGALINLDFDYQTYFQTLKSAGLNHTRLWMGPHRSADGDFDIPNDTLNPVSGRWITPWKTSGGKFNLSSWNPAYFTRLHSLMRAAADAQVIVEITLFSVYYFDTDWNISPFNPSNNINDTWDADRFNALSTENGRLFAFQENYVRKLVQELNPYGNLYFEIVNEAVWGGGATQEFQKRVAEWIISTEADLPNQHLIAQDQGEASQPDIAHEGIKIWNMHYSKPGEISSSLWFRGVIGNNETGFFGTADDGYRKEAWTYLLEGAGLYSMLDYSFTVGHEDGSNPQSGAPGGGSAELRKQLAILKRFIESFHFVRMSPDLEVVTWGNSGNAIAMSEPGQQYALYLDGAHQLGLNLPGGYYQAKWVDTLSGQNLGNFSFSHAGGEKELSAPDHVHEVALSIRRLN